MCKALVVAVLSTFLFSTLAQADNPSYTAPDRSVLDFNGVELGDAVLQKSFTILSIGDPNNGGLAWGLTGHSGTDSYSGTLEFWPSNVGNTGNLVRTSMRVKLAGSTDSFDGDCLTTCANKSGGSSTLVGSGWKYTTGDGTVYIFDSLATPDNSMPANTSVQFIGKLLWIQKPNGVKITINYSNLVGCAGIRCFQIQSVISNRGYALKYEYNPTTYGLTKVSTVNLAVHACNANITICDGVDSSVTFSASGATDDAGNTWSISTAHLNDGLPVPGQYYKEGVTHYTAPGGDFADAMYDGYGRILTLTNPLGTWTYSYSDVSLIDVQNRASHQVTVKDPSNAIVLTAWVSKGDHVVQWKTDALGRTTHYGYDANSFDETQHLISITSPEGDYINHTGQVAYTYDARGNVTSVSHIPKSGSGLTAITEYASYDTTCANPKTCNQPNWTKDAKGNYTYYTYDATHGGVLSITAPADSAGLTPKTVTTYAQFTAQTKDAATGNLVNAGTIWLPQTTSTCSTAVTCDGSVNQIKTTTVYGTSNLLPTSVTTAAGDNTVTATVLTAYDNVGNSVSVDGPRTDVSDVGYTTYDAARRPVFEIAPDPDGAGPLKREMTHHIYNDGHETQTETGTGSSTSGSDFVRLSYVVTHYNTFGQKDQVTSYVNGSSTPQALTQYSYDSHGQLVCTAVRMNLSITQPTDACTPATAGSFGPDRISKNLYDAAGQLTEVDQGVGVQLRQYARYTYSANGLKTSETDANNNRTLYTYNGLDRLTKVQYPSPTLGANTASTTDFETFGYDANGNRTSWLRRNGKTITSTFDNLNRENITHVSDSSVADIYTAYDLAGRILYKRFGSGAGAGVSYAYDGLGRASSTTDYNNRTLNYQYNQASARTRLTWADSGTYIASSLDTLNRTTSQSWNGSTVLTSQAYDDLGRRIALGRGAGSIVGTTSYAYDNLGRLASLTNDLAGASNDITWTFSSYNPAGQIATWGASSIAYDYKETASATVSNTYNGLNQDAAIAALANGYDANGNMTNDGQRAMTYDVYNRLLTVAGSGVNVKLVYDPEGRLAKYSTDGGATYTTFQYDGSNLISEYTTAGGLAERYIHGTGTDEPLVWFHGWDTSDQRFFYQNYQGSVIGYTNASGGLTELYKYSPYGEPKDASNNASWSGSRFRYTGQVMLPEVRLYYYKARVYDPIAGRFLQTDPVGSKDDLDLYAYVGGDPINRNDPTGLMQLDSIFDTGTEVSRKPGGMDYKPSESASAGTPAVKGGGRVGLGGLVGAVTSSIVDSIKSKQFAGVTDQLDEYQKKGYNITYHYTNLVGVDGIALSQQINTDSRGRAYFTFRAMGPEEANDSLMMGNDFGKSNDFVKGSYVVIMAMKPGYPMQSDPSTVVSQGFYTNSAIRNGRGVYFLYEGRNFFPNNSAWDH